VGWLFEMLDATDALQTGNPSSAAAAAAASPPPPPSRLWLWAKHPIRRGARDDDDDDDQAKEGKKVELEKWRSSWLLLVVYVVGKAEKEVVMAKREEEREWGGDCAENEKKTMIMDWPAAAAALVLSVMGIMLPGNIFQTIQHACLYFVITRHSCSSSRFAITTSFSTLPTTYTTSMSKLLLLHFSS
jgi:hypothetical protein